MFKILERRGVPPKMLNLIKALHHEVKAKVKVDGEFTESFQLGAGLKQGGVLSVLLWSIYMGAVVEKVHKEFELNGIKGIPIKFNPRSNIFRTNSNLMNRNSDIKYINEVLFVDDIVEFSPTKSIEQQKLEIWYRVLGRYHQEISIPKTNIMSTGLGVEVEKEMSIVVNGAEINQLINSSIWAFMKDQITQ